MTESDLKGWNNSLFSLNWFFVNDNGTREEVPMDPKYASENKHFMDKLGQLVYKNPDLVYKYKGVVETPSLGMVDDILSIQKCSNDTVKMNAVINSFVEGKKLKLSGKKCHRIHVQNKKTKNHPKCKDLKVHEEPMKNSTQEKYFGDVINSNGTIRDTLEDRKNKGFGIVCMYVCIYFLQVQVITILL